ncbi:MAG: hypothetical protein K2Q18_15135 [Bdellovibrionales bacterium]|nr:hypothetical protein [Bdellovibrionales bacterium]
MKKLWFSPLLLTFFITNSAHAYKFVIFTDESATDTSSQVKEVLLKTYPFSTLNVEVEIVRVPSSDLECESGATRSGKKVERMVTCKDTESIQKRALAKGGQQAMIVKNITKYGGSSGIGGGVPVITTGSPPRVMLHEFLHTLGLCDEYAYPEEEAKDFCEDVKINPNAAYIQPQSSYGSDSEARAMHSGQIPWYGDIFATTRITNSSQLGTGVVSKELNAPNDNTIPAALSEPTGLYRGKTCDNAIPKIKKVVWHPGGKATIMDSNEAGLGAPLEKIVQKIMLSKGARRKLDSSYGDPDVTPEATPTVGPGGNSNGGEVIATSQPPDNVNDTGRGFFKSFFGWIKSIFESIGRAFSR